MEQEIQDRLIKPEFLIRTGSSMYGYALPESDEDFRGFCTVPYPYLLGRKRFDQHIRDKDEDIVIYSLPKFFTLLENGTPNILEMLYCDDKNIIECGPLARKIIENRHLFLANEKVIKAIVGFSTSEYQKVIHPERGEKGPKRQELIAKHGYDIKSMSHAIRLLHQGYELLKYGEITYPLSISDYLLQLRTGEFSLIEASFFYEAKLSQLRLIEQTPHHFFTDKVSKDKLDMLYYFLIEHDIKQFKDRSL